MRKKLSIYFAFVLVFCLLIGCGAKPVQQASSSTPAPTSTPAAQNTPAQHEKNENDVEKEEIEQAEVEEIDMQEIPDDVAGGDAGVTSNAEDWKQLLCNHPWQALDDLPDGSKWISIYTFKEDGTFTYFGGWNRSEADADYAGIYEISEDGILTLIYTTGHEAEITYELGFNIETITFTQIGDEGLMTFHKDGCTTTLSAA